MLPVDSCRRSRGRAPHASDPSPPFTTCQILPSTRLVASLVQGSVLAREALASAAVALYAATTLPAATPQAVALHFAEGLLRPPPQTIHPSSEGGHAEDAKRNRPTATRLVAAAGGPTALEAPPLGLVDTQLRDGGSSLVHQLQGLPDIARVCALKGGCSRGRRGGNAAGGFCVRGSMRGCRVRDGTRVSPSQARVKAASPRQEASPHAVIVGLIPVIPETRALLLLCTTTPCAVPPPLKRHHLQRHLPLAMQGCCMPCRWRCAAPPCCWNKPQGPASQAVRMAHVPPLLRPSPGCCSQMAPSECCVPPYRQVCVGGGGDRWCRDAGVGGWELPCNQGLHEGVPCFSNHQVLRHADG